MLLQQLESFIAVAEASNFTHAAQNLHISQPTLSRQVKMLEDELGCTLFQRNKRPLRLTQAGEVFYDGMRKALAQIDYTWEMAKAASHGKFGKLSIGFTNGLYAEYMFLDVVNDLKDTCRSLDVMYTKREILDLAMGLQDESIDIAFSFDFGQYVNAGLRITRLSRVPTLVVMSARHKLAGKSALERDDLDGQTLYLNSPVESYQLDEWMDQVFNLDRIRVEEVSSIEEAYMMALSEQGLCISNSYDPILQNNPLYHCVLLPDESLYPYACAVDNPANSNAAKELLLDLLRNSSV